MKAIHCVSMILLGVSSVCLAQNAPADDPSLPPVQAPPGMHDPGVAAQGTTDQAATPGKAAKAKTSTKGHESDGPGLPPDLQAKADVAELPVITVRQRGSDTVEEYRKHGKLIFVRVLSKEGPPKYYVDNPANIPPDLMQNLSGPSGIVHPVYYKLYEWK